MAIRSLSRLKIPTFSLLLIQILTKSSQNPSPISFPLPQKPNNPNSLPSCLYHDGRPRGALWRGKKMIGKEALFVILGLKRFKDAEEKVEKFIKSHVKRLLKMDMIAVLNELERQEEVELAVKMFGIIQKEKWYKPDVYLYKDLIISLAKSKKMEDAMQVWDNMRKEELFPDAQTYAEVIRGFMKYRSPADAMNIYEDMKISPDPPERQRFC